MKMVNGCAQRRRQEFILNGRLYSSYYEDDGDGTVRGMQSVDHLHVDARSWWAAMGCSGKRWLEVCNRNSINRLPIMFSSNKQFGIITYRMQEAIYLPGTVGEVGPYATTTWWEWHNSNWYRVPRNDITYRGKSGWDQAVDHHTQIQNKFFMYPTKILVNIVE